MTSKKKLIYNFINREKRVSTSKIGSYVGLPIHYARKYLEEMEKDGILVKEEETNSIYWRIK